MNNHAKEFTEWVTKNGYGTLERVTGGDHLRFRLRNGETLTTGSTPSKYSAVKNAKAEVLKLLGIGSQSPAAGKIRFKPRRGRVKAKPFQGPLTKDLQEQVEAIDERLASLGDPRSGRVRSKVLDLISERIECVAELERRGVRVPPLPNLTSGGTR